MDVYPKKSKNCADPTRKCRKLLEIGICMSRSTSVWFDSASLRIPSATINITEQREWELLGEKILYQWQRKFERRRRLSFAEGLGCAAARLCQIYIPRTLGFLLWGAIWVRGLRLKGYLVKGELYFRPTKWGNWDKVLLSLIIKQKTQWKSRNGRILFLKNP